ncbi:hypothetical protein L3Q82_021605 [Scortum barcoo]|uniref:Uncharacterized protein n=1 Tax=Scortum barcoo TaxID=214431 RepID=A0ACB8X4V6_9TELE|nr:hypothetical protein L3Q82_021605 [Scortum barcoo]
MIVDNTCIPGNGTAECSAPSSSVGLAVGLTLFFLLLVIVAAVMVYKYHSEIRNIWLQFEHRRGQKTEDDMETPQANSHEYTSTITEQTTGQVPIYENLTTQSGGYNRPQVYNNRLPAEPEEDVYLQCDLPDDDDAIYSNDPVCDLSIQEEDLYIVPDS